jgi:hypothetical protein
VKPVGERELVRVVRRYTKGGKDARGATGKGSQRS